MATLSEWLAGETSAGVQLDPAKVAKYRSRREDKRSEDSLDFGNYSLSSNSPKIIFPKVYGVGTALHDLLLSIGLSPPCVSCGTYAAQMDSWKIEGCKTTYYAEIVGHLKAEAKAASWLDWGKVALAGYLSSEALLNKAIEMAEAKQREKVGEPC